jgi:CDP-diacylglycerol--serine O-phosphatidyltransferase
MAAFSALRLAKFNLDERQTTSFIGLPTPANALFWGALLVGYGSWIESTPVNAPLLVLMILISCYLLVSEIPMFALKFKQWGWRGNEVKYLFVIISAIMLLLFRLSGFALVIAWYVVLSLFTARNDKPSNN